MQSKTKTYILLASVLGIWGVIGYKIISTLNPETPELASTAFNTSFTPKVTTTLDTFSIQATERDPFLGTLYTKKRLITKSTKKVEVVWLPIVYHGSVTQQASGNKIFVISINGEQHLMKLGQTIKEIKLLRANANEITLSYKGERKKIKKS